MIGAYTNLDAYCRSRGLQYVYFSSNDLDREMGDDLRTKIQRVVHDEHGLSLLHSTPLGTVYKVKLNIPSRPPYSPL